MDKISVIIPVYNASGSIERCLDSVLAQTYAADYEIILVNDGSTDNSREIIEKYVKSHNANFVVIDKANGGAASARNEGMRRSTGDWIALLDSDDEWLPEKIEKQMSVLHANPEIDHLGCNVTTGTIRLLWHTKKTLSPVKIWEQFISWHPATPTVIFKRTILDDVGYYNESFTHLEDGEFLARICMAKNCWFMPDHLVAIGGGKPTYGYSGLSANLKGMANGERKVLKYTYNRGAINVFQYVVFYMYMTFKYWRRVIVTKMRLK